MPSLVPFVPVQHALLEGFRILRVRGLARPVEGGELLFPSLADRLHHPVLGEADKEAKGGGLPVFLAHEDQRQKGAGEQKPRGQLVRLKGEERGKAIPLHAVAHLVVVLGVDHELFPGAIPGGVAVPAAAIGGVEPVVHIALGQGFLQVPGVTEVLVVPLPFPGEQGVDAVVEVVRPLRGVAQAAQGGLPDEPGVVGVAFREQMHRPAQPPLQAPRLLRQLLEEGAGAHVEYGVHRVQAQPVQVEVLDPGQGVVQEKGAHLVAVRRVEVEGWAPGRGVLVREVGPEVRQIVSLGPQMIVHHIQDHGQAPGVTGVHQLAQGARTAVGVLHREGQDPVVAPVASPGELGRGHEAQAGDAQGRDLVQAGNDGPQGALRGEGPRMHFVKNEVLQGEPPPGPVGPGK